MADLSKHPYVMPARTPRRFRCTRGHEWEEVAGDTDVVFVLNGKPLCLRCLGEFAEKHLGMVEEVK